MAFTFQATAWNSATTPKATASMTWAAGDEVIAVGLSEGANVTLNTPTATGLTFSLVTSQTTGGTAECGAYLWRATAASGGSGAISFTRGATSGFFGGAAWVRPGTASAVVALTGNVSEAAYNTTVVAGDDVIVAGADWNATTPAKTPLTGSGTATERVDTGATNLGVWIADWQGTAAGTFDFGPNNFTGMRWAQVGIVMRAGAAAIELATASTAGLTLAATAAVTHELAATSTAGATLAASAAATHELASTSTAGLTLAATGASAVNLAATTSAGLTLSATGSAAAGVIELAAASSAALTLTATGASTVELARTSTAGLTLAATATTTVQLAATTAAGLTLAATGASVAELAAASTSGLTLQATGPTAAVTLLGTFARANADPHSITIPGATAGRDVYLVVNAAAVITTPSGWTSVTSRIVDMDSHVFVLPGASNPGGDLAVTLDLTAGRPLAAIALETAPADSGTSYASLVAPINAPGSTTWGTGAHTYTTRDTALAIYCLYSPGATGSVPTFGVTGFDRGFTLLGDTGWAGTGTSADEGSRIIIGQASNVGFTASGVVLTLDAAGPTGAALGFLAFDTGNDSPAELATASSAGLTLAATGATAVELAANSTSGLTLSATAGAVALLAANSTAGMTLAATGVASIVVLVDPVLETTSVAEVTPLASAAELAAVSSAGLTLRATGSAGAVVAELASTSTAGLTLAATAVVTVQLAATSTSGLTLVVTAGQVVDLAANSTAGLTLRATGAVRVELATTSSAGLTLSVTGAASGVVELAASSTAGVTLAALAVVVAQLAAASSSGLTLTAGLGLQLEAERAELILVTLEPTRLLRFQVVDLFGPPGECGCGLPHFPRTSVATMEALIASTAAPSSAPPEFTVADDSASTPPVGATWLAGTWLTPWNARTGRRRAASPPISSLPLAPGFQRIFVRWALPAPDDALQPMGSGAVRAE